MQTNTNIASIFQGLREQTNDIFACMESAEAEIAVAMRQYPNRCDMLYGTFLSLRPLFPFCSDMLYRAHCRELLERVAYGEDVTQPTRAEMLELLQRVSAFIPFHSHAGALYRLVFEEVFPGKFAEAADGVETLNERFPGETDPLRVEIIGELLKVTAKREQPRLDTRWRGEENSHESEQLELFS